MKCCVIKNTVVVIDGSGNSQDVMLQNAVNAGYTELDVEILTDSEYKLRLSGIPPVIQPPTIENRIQFIEDVLMDLLI